MTLSTIQRAENCSEQPDFALPVHDAGMPQSWYAIAKSASIKNGQHRSVTCFGQDWVLFRAQDGQLATVARHCSHMGADLSRGCVRGQRLVCPLHRWEYGGNGDCHAEIPQRQAREATLASLATQEWAGIVFVFPARTPGFGLPRDLVPEQAQFSSTKAITVPTSYMAPALNTFDLSHYASVHNREFVQAPELRSDQPHHLAISFAARVIPRRWQDKLMKGLGFGTVEVTVDCWGASLLVMRNHKTGIGVVLGMEAIAPTSSRLYLTAFNLADAHPHGAGALLWLKLEFGRAITAAFLKADVPVLTGMLPRRGVLVPERDDAVLRFWQYFDKLPKVAQHDGN